MTLIRVLLEEIKVLAGCDARLIEYLSLHKLDIDLPDEKLLALHAFLFGF